MTRGDGRREEHHRARRRPPASASCLSAIVRVTCSVTLPSPRERLQRHRRDRPPRLDEVHPRPRIDPHDLVLHRRTSPRAPPCSPRTPRDRLSPKRPAVDPMNTRVAPWPSALGPVRASVARNARAVHIAPSKFTSITSRTRASSSSCEGRDRAGQAIPAFATHHRRAPTARRLLHRIARGRARDPSLAHERHDAARPRPPPARVRRDARSLRPERAHESDRMPPEAPVTNTDFVREPEDPSRRRYRTARGRNGEGRDQPTSGTCSRRGRRRSAARALSAAARPRWLVGELRTARTARPTRRRRAAGP